MYERKIPLPFDCGLYLTREVLNGKWKASLIYAIYEQIKRPSELQKAMPGATKRVLTLQLKQLEEHGIIAKTEASAKKDARKLSRASFLSGILPSRNCKSQIMKNNESNYFPFPAYLLQGGLVITRFRRCYLAH